MYTSLKLLIFLLVIFFGYCNSAFSQTDKSGRLYKTGIATGWILHYPDSTIDKIVSRCAQTGTTYMRIDFPWPEIQKKRSKQYDWDKLDGIIAIIQKYNLKTIAVIGYFPNWLDRDMTDLYWYNFAYEAGSRYIPKGVDVWELYNEPNSDYFYKNPNSEKYVRQILIPGSSAIRRAALECNKTVTILTGGTAPVNSNGKDISPLDFIRGIYTNGGKNYFDGIAVHPYSWPHDPLKLHDNNWFLKIKQIYDILHANQDSSKQLWCTEVGFPTCSAGIDENSQSDYMITCFESWFQETWAGPFLWYTIYDRGSNRNDPEDNFGIIRNDWSKKPAYGTFIKMVEKFDRQINYKKP